MCQKDELLGSLPVLPVEPGPVPDSDRMDSLDVLRGFAVLGILVMNIQAFSMIGPAYDRPTAYGDIQGGDYLAWLISHVLFSGKFMTIFTMLFGAGIVLMCGRREAVGRGSAGIHYRRMGVLLVFGLLHAYLLWHGDILLTYAMCGFWVYLCRNWRPSILIGIGLLLIAIPPLLSCGLVWTMQFWPADEIKDFLFTWTPAQERIDAETAAFLGGWWDQMGERANTALMIQTFAMVFWSSWMGTGLMCIGMALFKLEVFSAKRPVVFYLTMIVMALAVGVPTIFYGVHRSVEMNWHPKYAMFLGGQYNYLASTLVSLGWIALVMLVCKRRKWHGITRPFASVGRMALTNYLMQSVICTVIFYGHGFGMFGKVSRVGQLGFVLGVWVFQLIVSPIWLRYFRFGPLEWLWRSLTYWKRQTMLRA